MQFEPVIGLEVHAQLKTKTKIFCGCSTRFGKSPNASTCPVCTGMPGVLPVLNKQVVSFAIKAALATNCSINRESRFTEKIIFTRTFQRDIRYPSMHFPLQNMDFLKLKQKTWAPKE